MERVSRTARLALLSLLGFASCLQPTDTDIGVASPPGHKGATTSRLAGAASTGAGGSGSAASTSGGTTGGNSSSASTTGSSSGGAVPDAGGLQCPPGTAYATTQVVDLTGNASVQGTPVAGADVNEIGEDLVQLPGVGTSAVSDTNGNVQLCFPYDVPITLSIAATQTPATYVEELVVSDGGSSMAVDAGSAVFSDGIILLPDSLLMGLTALIPGGVTNTDAFVIVIVDSLAQTTCKWEPGWTFDLLLPDGGTLPDGGNQIPFVPAYLDTNGIPALGMSATSERGVAILFNIDPAVSNVAILTATNPDAGACPLLQGNVRPTGRVLLENSAVTYAPLFTP